MGNATNVCILCMKFANLLLQLSIFLIDLIVGTYRLSSHARLEAFVIRTKLNLCMNMCGTRNFTYVCYTRGSPTWLYLSLNKSIKFNFPFAWFVFRFLKAYLVVPSIKQINKIWFATCLVSVQIPLDLPVWAP
jgi:hypothetical protein